MDFFSFCAVKPISINQFILMVRTQFSQKIPNFVAFF
jgi:hypothetical protein